MRSLVIALMIVGPALVAGPVAATTAPEEAGQLYENALLRFNRGDLAGAAIQLRNALSKDPQNVPAHLLLGRAYLRVGLGVLSERHLIRARELGADERYYLAPLGRAYLLQKKYRTLVQEIRIGTRREDVEAEVRDIRGHAWLALNDLETAEMDFLAAQTLRSFWASPLLGLARVELRRGETGRAERLVKQALDAEPRSTDAWYLDGEIQRGRRAFDRALESFGKAIEADPNNVPARLGRAGLLSDLARDDAALADLEFVRRLIPDEPEAAYLEARLLRRAGRRREAAALFDRALAALHRRTRNQSEEDPAALLLLGAVKFETNALEEARQYLTHYLELAPRHTGARRMLATIALKSGETEHAIELLRSAIRLAPRDPELLTLMGDALARHGELDRAIETLERAVAFAPQRAFIRTRLGAARLAAGRVNEAVADLDGAIALDPDGSRPGLMLGMLYLRKGDYAAALKTAEKLHAAAPNDPFAQNLAGAARLASGEAKAARTAFESAIALQPDYVPAAINLARLDMAEGRVAEAIAREKAVLRQRPQNAGAMDALARIALQQGRTDDAADWLKRMAALSRSAVEPRRRLVMLHLSRGQVDLAVDEARELEAMHPSDPDALEAYGRALLESGEFESAAKRFGRLAEQVTGSPAELLRIAELQRRAHDIAGAAKSIETAVARFPGFLPGHVALIRHHARAGSFGAALDVARALRATHPVVRHGDIATGDLLMLMGRPDEAATAYRSAMAKKADSLIVRRLHGAEYRAGRKTESVALLEGWIGSHPDDLAAARLLAITKALMGLVPDAIAINERLLERSPDDPAVLNNLAGLYHRAGDARALHYAERAYAAVRDPTTLDTLGWILVDSGEVERGLALLRQALHDSDGAPEVGYHVAVALSRLGRVAEARAELERALHRGAEFAGSDEAQALLRRLGND